jgi:predicted polyphosphate/ATP-dependent NAD kinase
LIINPIAGMGGRVGLKGTDGRQALERARHLGAVPRAGERTREALRRIVRWERQIRILTCPGAMGEEAARAEGFEPELIGEELPGETSARDTQEAARSMLDHGVDLLCFAGGDGTARDIVNSVEQGQVCLGFPAGVKIHSAVFSHNPRSGGDLAADFLLGKVRRTRSCEVMDIDENEYRKGNLSARLCGYLLVPDEIQRLQGQKTRSPAGEQSEQQAVAAEIVARMDRETTYILGPGTTTGAVLKAMGLEGTLLGVDVLRDQKIVGKDVDEAQLLSLNPPAETRLIITPVGGQGFILGRGNQQISPQVLSMFEKQHIWIVSTQQKLSSLHSASLRLDTGDAELDLRLSGYHRVITGRGEEAVYRVTP